MSAKPLPPQDVLNEMFAYDPETGGLTWKVRPEWHFKEPGRAKAWNTRHAGTPALNYMQDGYLHGCLANVGKVKAHRVIWKMVHGTEPETIDHLNHVRSDNRMQNLRAASDQENRRNVRRLRRHPLGVYRRANRPGWQVSIWRDGRLVHLGDFRCFAKAWAARREAQAADGFHPHHGRTEI